MSPLKRGRLNRGKFKAGLDCRVNSSLKNARAGDGTRQQNAFVRKAWNSITNRGMKSNLGD